MDRRTRGADYRTSRANRRLVAQMHVYRSDEGEIVTSRDVYSHIRTGDWDGILDGVEVGSSMDHDLTYTESGQDHTLTYLGTVSGKVSQMTQTEREQAIRRVVGEASTQ